MDSHVSLPAPVLEHEMGDHPAGRPRVSRPALIYVVPIVCVVAFLVYLPALSCRAVFHDDAMYLMDNALVRNPSWNSVGRFFTEVLHPSSVTGYYQPLTMVSLMVDYALAGPSAGLRQFHQTTLLLHVANTGLVVLLLYLLFGEVGTAAAVGLLFGVHPMAVDSVCWISERKTVLAAFFGLWSLIFYVLFAQAGRRRFYVACLVTFVLALLSKPITVPLPLVMVLMDYWPLNRLRWATVREKLPLFTIAAIFAVITCISQSRTAPVLWPGQYPPAYVPLIVCHNIVFYAYRLFWPASLSPYYGFPRPFSVGHPMVLAGVFGTLMLLSLLFVSIRRTRMFLTGWLVFFVALLPALGILSVTPVIAANRYAYFPSVGFLFTLGGLATWIERRKRRGHIQGSLIVATVCLVLAGAESLGVRRYLNHWRDTTALYGHMLTITPSEAILHNGLAFSLSQEGRREEAIQHYREALRLSPNLTLAHLNLAASLGESADTREEAAAHYRRALELEPSNHRAQIDLGDVLFLQGKQDEAIDYLARAVQATPEDVIGQHHLGKILVVTGHPDAGIDHLKQALRLSPAYLPAVKDLAWFLATHPDNNIRDPNTAIQLGRRAARASRQQDARALDTLAAAFAAAGEYQKAVEMGQKAVEMAKRVRSHELAEDIQGRLQLYRSGCAYYEDPQGQFDRLATKTKQPTQGEESAPDHTRSRPQEREREVRNENPPVSTE